VSTFSRQVGSNEKQSKDQQSDNLLRDCLRYPRRQKTDESPQNPAGVWQVDAILAIRVFLNQEAVGTVTVQAGRAPASSRGQRAVLSPLRQLCEQSRDDWWVITQ